jgi:hypothetical protein
MSVVVEEVRTDFGPSESQSRRKGPAKKFWGVQAFKKQRIFAAERELPRIGTIFNKYIRKISIDQILELPTSAIPVTTDEKQRSSSLNVPISEMHKQLATFLERYPKQYEKSTSFGGIENILLLKSPNTTPVKLTSKNGNSSDQMIFSKIGTDESQVKDECTKLINNLKKRKIYHLDESHMTYTHVNSSTSNTSPFKRRKILSPFKQVPHAQNSLPTIIPLKSPSSADHKPISAHSLKFSDLKNRTPKHKTATGEPKRSKRHDASAGQSWSTNSTPARPGLIATKELAGRTLVKTQFKTAPLHDSVVPMIHVTLPSPVSMTGVTGPDALNTVDLQAVEGLANLGQSAKSNTRRQLFKTDPETGDSTVNTSALIGGAINSTAVKMSASDSERNKENKTN